MDSLKQARFIQSRMWGIRHIYYDRVYKCFRVMKDNSLAFIKYLNHYEFVE